MKQFNVLTRSGLSGKGVGRLTAILLSLCLVCVEAVAQHVEVGIHDPVMAKEDDRYYVFGTGAGVTVYSSTDLENWEREPSVFETTPDWVHAILPDFGRSMWAPDIIYRDGTYYLYYSVSRFGRNTSAIGVATNSTLRSDDPEFEWVDRGMVVKSVPGRDMWNAIDANVVIDDEGVPWMTFGSFWMGMKLVRLHDNMIEIDRNPEEWHTIAARYRYWMTDERSASGVGAPFTDAAVEAPFIFKKNGYYYLFVSWDRCCRGEESTYKVVVGRSENVQGPYVDKEGEQLVHGGGSWVAGGDGVRYAAIGHNSAYTFDGTDYFVAHAYDLSDEGRSKLLIVEMEWDDHGWPIVRLDD